MRTQGWIVLVALACACGEDGDGPNRNDGGPSGDGDGDGDPGDGDGDGPGCEGEFEDYPGYDLPPVWGNEELVTCEGACPDLQPSSCLEQNLEGACLGVDEFFTCLDEEMYQCQTMAGGDCRREFEELSCCFNECDDGSSEQVVVMCLEDNCMAANTTVEDCYLGDQESPAFARCIDAAYNNCLVGGAQSTACTPADVVPVKPFTGTRPWTRTWTAAEVATCKQTCASEPAVALCVSQQCPGADAYRVCEAREVAACATQPGGQCRASWEALFCCTRDNCGGATTEQQLAACLAAECATESTAFDTCDTMSQTGTCLPTAKAACAAGGGNPDAGVPSDAGPDAQVPAARLSSPSLLRFNPSRLAPAASRFENYLKLAPRTTTIGR